MLFLPREIFTQPQVCLGGGVFCITANDSMEDENAITNEDLHILMHAITGVITTNTICLCVKINGIELKALVDSGPTHTFIHDDVAQRLGLDITSRPNLRVTVANGECLRSPGVCATTLVSIHDEKLARVRHRPGRRMAEDFGTCHVGL